MSKANDIESEERTLAVVDLLLGGAQRRHIIQFCAKNYGIKARQSDVYIKKAKDLIVEQSLNNRDYNISISLERYHHLYAKNYKVQDYRECRAVQTSIDKLLGLLAPEKHDHTTDGEKISIPPILFYKPEDDDNSE